MLFNVIIPHIFLISAILFVLMCNTLIIRSRNEKSRVMNHTCFVQVLVVLFILLILLINIHNVGAVISNSNFKYDFSLEIIQVITVLLMLFSFPSVFLSFRSQNLNFFEFFVLVLVVLLAILFIINANSLLALFVSVEIFALCSIILVAFNNISALSTEAGLKYFISSATFSGIFLLGASFIYFAYGTVCFSMLFDFKNSSIGNFETSLPLYSEVGFLLVNCWLLFKITSAPFHFWVSDVYDGAPLATTIFFSIVPKFALVIFLIKWIKLYFLLSNYIGSFLIFVLCGIVSCIFGFIAALKQKKVKKLFIYSSVGQVGLVVAGTFLGGNDGFISVIVFSVIYYINSILVWNTVSVLFALDAVANKYNSKKVTPFNLTQLAGLYYRNPALALLICFIVFSLSGIPPLLGFFGKYENYLALVNSGNFFPVMLIVLLSALTSAYYLEMLRPMFFKGDLKQINGKGDFKISSYDDKLINLVNSISCFLVFVIIWALFYPELIIDVATLIIISMDC